MENTKEELLHSIVNGYDNDKKAIEIEPVTFKNEFSNGHTVKYISGSPNYFIIGTPVIVRLANGIIPQLSKYKIGNL